MSEERVCMVCEAAIGDREPALHAMWNPVGARPSAVPDEGHGYVCEPCVRWLAGRAEHHGKATKANRAFMHLNGRC